MTIPELRVDNVVVLDEDSHRRYEGHRANQGVAELVYCLEALVKIIDEPTDEPDFYNQCNGRQEGAAGLPLSPPPKIPRSKKVFIEFTLKREGQSEESAEVSASWPLCAKLGIARFLTRNVIPFDPLLRSGRYPMEPLLTADMIVSAALGGRSFAAVTQSTNAEFCDYDLYVVKTTVPAVFPSHVNEDDIFGGVAATRRNRKGSIIMAEGAFGSGGVSTVAKQSSGNFEPELISREVSCSVCEGEEEFRPMLETVVLRTHLLNSLGADRCFEQAPKVVASQSATSSKRNVWNQTPKNPSIPTTAATGGVGRGDVPILSPPHKRLYCANVTPLLHVALIGSLGLPMICTDCCSPTCTGKEHQHHDSKRRKTQVKTPTDQPLPPLEFEMRLHTPETVLRPDTLYEESPLLYTKKLALLSRDKNFFGVRANELRTESDDDRRHTSQYEFVASCNYLAFDALQDWNYAHSSSSNGQSILKHTFPLLKGQSGGGGGDTGPSFSPPSKDERLQQQLLSYYTEFKLMRGLSRIHPYINSYVSLFVECPCVEVTVHINMESLVGVRDVKKKKSMLAKRRAYYIVEGSALIPCDPPSSEKNNGEGVSAPSEKKPIFSVYFKFVKRTTIRSCCDVVRVSDMITECSNGSNSGGYSVQITSKVPAPIPKPSNASVIKLFSRIAICSPADLDLLRSKLVARDATAAKTTSDKIIAPIGALLLKKQFEYQLPTATDFVTAITNFVTAISHQRVSSTSCGAGVWSDGVWAGLTLVKGQPVVVPDGNNQPFRLQFFKQLKEALLFLHHHHVFFADMKLENCVVRPVVVSNEEDIKYELADFGSAVLLLPTTISLHSASSSSSSPSPSSDTNLVSCDSSFDSSMLNRSEISAPITESSHLMWIHRFCDYFLRSLVVRGSPSHRHPSLLLLAPLYQPSGVVRDDAKSKHYRAHIVECHTHLHSSQESIIPAAPLSKPVVKSLLGMNSSLSSLVVGVTGHMFLTAAAGLLPSSASDAELQEVINSLGLQAGQATGRGSDLHSIDVVCSLCVALSKLPREVDRWALGVASMDNYDPQFSNSAFQNSLGIESSASVQQVLAKVRLNPMDDHHGTPSFNGACEIPPTPMSTCNFQSSFPPITPTTVTSSSSSGICDVVYSLLAGGVDDNNQRVRALSPNGKQGMPSKCPSSMSVSSMLNFPSGRHPSQAQANSADECCRRQTVLSALVPFLETVQNRPDGIDGQNSIHYGSPVGQKWNEKKRSEEVDADHLSHLDEVEGYCFAPCSTYTIGDC